MDGVLLGLWFAMQLMSGLARAVWTTHQWRASSQLKAERVHHPIYEARGEARRDLFQYIEGFYNSRRLHPVLGYISPAFADRMAA